MPPEARLLIRLGLGLWLLAALATVWELLALQPPGSPLHLGVLAGPIAQLRNFAFAHGVAALIIARLQPARWVAWLLALGAVLHVLALGYAAAKGLLAVQLLDPRPDARFTLYARGVAHTLTTIALIALCVRRQSS
ncbi:MAG TPA: hypothetical protein VFX59_26945 [Polyangiales bacterium]|nr:hypothetical protein [Polyangiales bacterium]